MILFLCVSDIFSFDLKKINFILNNKNILSLEDFLEISNKQNPNFEKILIDELKIKYNKFLDMPSEEILLNLKSDYYFKEDSTSETISLSKLFAKQGTTIETGYEYNDTDRGSFLIALDQSLLKNAFGRANKLKLTEIEQNNKIIRYEIVEAYEEYFAEITSLYYEWSRVFVNLEIARNAYEDNLKINKNIKSKFNNNVANIGDVEKSNLQLLEKEENLRALEAEYKKIYNLIVQAGRIDSKKIFVPNIKMKDIDIDLDINMNNFKLDFDKEYFYFQKNSRTYFIYDLIRDKSLSTFRIAKDDSLDDLGLSFSYRDSKKNSNKGFFVGLSYEGNFFDKKKSSVFKVAEIDYKKTLLDVSIKKYDIHITLKNLYEDLILQKDLLKIYNDKIKRAEVVVNEDTKYYNIGKLSFNDLVESINSLEKYRSEKVDRCLQFKTSILNWRNATDKLVNEEKILNQNKIK